MNLGRVLKNKSYEQRVKKMSHDETVENVNNCHSDQCDNSVTDKINLLSRSVLN